MKSTVYFAPLSAKSSAAERAAAGKKVFSALLENSNIALASEVPLKLHFGERGNRTYLKPEIYDPLIDILESRQVKSCFAETSVLYGGERFEAARHIRLAESHGFTRLPVVIADGDRGECSRLVEIPNGRHFKYAAVAEKLAEAEQVLVVSHFKGHMLAGFGGALKQLSMGFAAKGGKMAMHLSVAPKIRQWKCRRCKLCQTRCNVGAITIEEKRAFIDTERCVGCGACFSICPAKAISVFSLSGIKNMLFGKQIFREKLAEYAYAGHHGKRNIYLNFVADVTCGCDCEPRKMFPCIPDVGVFASLDPVAVDAASYSAALKFGKKFKGYNQLEYAAKLGIGSLDYTVAEI